MKTDEDILKEVKSFGYDKYINIDEIVKKAISLTRQAEQKRILELINKKKQRRIDYLLQENSGESISKAEQLADELDEIDTLAGEKLI